MKEEGGLVVSRMCNSKSPTPRVRRWEREQRGRDGYSFAKTPLKAAQAPLAAASASQEVLKIIDWVSFFVGRVGCKESFARVGQYLAKSYSSICIHIMNLASQLYSCQIRKTSQSLLYRRQSRCLHWLGVSRYGPLLRLTPKSKISATLLKE